ncbi:hypothetical protein BDW66DRAFT_124458 [Aspergillus desertorum]
MMWLASLNGPVSCVRRVIRLAANLFPAGRQQRLNSFQFLLSCPPSLSHSDSLCLPCDTSIWHVRPAVSWQPRDITQT